MEQESKQMKKNWKARLIDIIIFVAIVILLTSCALCVFITFEFIAYLIFGAEALTNLALWLIAILSIFVVLVIFAFATRR